MHEAVHDNRLGGSPFDEMFLEHAKIRSSFLKALANIPATEPTHLVAARIDSALNAVAARARSKTGWPHYDQWLDALLDVLEEWPIGQLPPALFHTIASQLVTLAPHLDPDGHRTVGTAFAASETWQRRRTMLRSRPRLLEALHDFAELKRAKALVACLPARVTSVHLRARG